MRRRSTLLKRQAKGAAADRWLDLPVAGMPANASNLAFGACVGVRRLHHDQGTSCRKVKSPLTDDIRRREASYSGRVRACPLGHSHVDHPFVLVADGSLDLSNKDRRHLQLNILLSWGGPSIALH